jgi:hemoglobin-like flavoprotein
MTDRAHGQATLFISYSHTQREQMQLLKKHLEGALFGRGVVWSDEAIAHGSRWETRLRGQLKNADAALLLVAPEYLASQWCRRELKIIADEQKAGRLKKVFWIQVEPAVWRGTELAAFQSWDFNLSQALSEVPDVHLKHRTIVKICEDIAVELDAVSVQLDDNLTFVRQILVDEAVDHGLVVDSSLSKGHGMFATVCRGRKGDEDVAIKVLRRSNLKELSAAFSDMVDARMSLENQCFIRVLGHFPVTGRHDQFHVIVEEFVGSDVTRLDEFLATRRGRTLGVDEIATVVRRAAEALKEFHEAGPRVGRAFGLLTPKHLFFDARGQRLLMPMASVSNFLWGTLGWEQLAAWQDEQPNLATYVAPEVADGHKATELTDQYMLGQLAFDMLEGGLPLDIKRPSEVGKKQAFWDDPARTAKGAWVQAHGAFARIIFRMMKRNPAERWHSFAELGKRLLDLEDESRALAKRTYHGLDGFTLQDNRAFFDAFYAEFFKRSPESISKFTRLTDQSQKLMDSMIAVLNYRDSNEPTSLSRVVDVHRRLRISAEELDDFRDAFLETLRASLPRRMPAARREAILAAWRDLFEPVVEYFTQAMPDTGARHRPAVPDVRPPAGRPRAVQRRAPKR